MQWTDEQKRIIEEQDSNILVSAAAGSGKTAVLVERIMQKILDEKNPMDIDEFLVVTFTNAAAGQMKDKIASKIEKALEERPESQHLMKQLVLIHRADITTIDSFCMRVVKEHFSTLNIESSFGIGDSGVMEMMKYDVLEAMFNEKYKMAYEIRSAEAKLRENEEYCSFTELVDIFAQDKGDINLKSQILKIYNLAESYPQPEEWIKNAINALNVESEEDFNDLVWVKKIIDISSHRNKEVLAVIEANAMLCDEMGGPDKNRETSEEDIAKVKKLVEYKDYQSLYQAYKNTKWTRLKSCKGDSYDEDIVNEYTEKRDSYKKAIDEINLYNSPIDECINEIKQIRRYIIPLLKLVSEFSDEYMKVKNERKTYDFSDIEHMAYRLVCDGYDTAGNVVPSLIGKSLSEKYSEIFIDEYQDSNFLQEDILCSVSRINEGSYNMFMVGDVKQSIYRFRMARPDLFMDKYNRYNNSGNEIKIELKNNFRSRAIVLDAVNFLFYQLMGRDFGGIEYDKNVALVPSKDMPNDEDKKISDCTEILIADYTTDSMSEKLTKYEIEGNMIADRIKALVDIQNGLDVFDEDANCMRKATFKDIVILSRSMKEFGEAMRETLIKRGIPVQVDDPKGYFNAVEISNILSLLSVIDNSRQDVAMAAVLLSPMADVSESELVVINSYVEKEYDKKLFLWDKCELYMEEYDDDLSAKLKSVIDIIKELKVLKHSLSISELIWEALNKTKYYYYVTAMPMGNKRKANIDMLLEKADAFEDGYYKGLFNFLRYIDKLKTNDVDFGEATIVDKDQNVVRIMSMHKSKGLEYPIVFVSGLGKGFNAADKRNNLVLHSDYFCAAKVMNNELRSKKDTFIRDSFLLLSECESMAEEMRILYVALTRAKEKLILTACQNNNDKLVEKMDEYSDYSERLLPISVRMKSKTFLEQIMIAMSRYKSYEKIVQNNEKPIINTHIFSYDDIVRNIVSEDINKQISLHEIDKMAEPYFESGRIEEVEKYVDYYYPYTEFTTLPGKMSISEIKKMKAFDGEGFDEGMPDVDAINRERLLADIENDNTLEINLDLQVKEKDKNIRGITRFSGAERGTIIHKFMELVDFAKLELGMDYSSYVEEYAQALLQDGVFNENEIKVINKKTITMMLNSPLGQRMIVAAKKKMLFKEQQFSIGISAKDIYSNKLIEMSEAQLSELNDVIIVQGIIDAFFIEDGQIVVMDYKTDNATEDVLVGRYKAQLDYYAETVCRLLNRPLKNKVLYSFHLNKEIIID